MNQIMHIMHIYFKETLGSILEYISVLTLNLNLRIENKNIKNTSS